MNAAMTIANKVILQCKEQTSTSRKTQSLANACRSIHQLGQRRQIPLLARRLLAQSTFGPDHFWPRPLLARFRSPKIAKKNDHFWPAPNLTTFGPDHFWPPHPLTIHNVKMTFGKNPGRRSKNKKVRVRVKASRGRGPRDAFTRTRLMPTFGVSAERPAEGPKVGV